jgi:DNA-binding transcriptional ArsR family regulator
MLYEELSRKFGCQVVEPFKEPVIIVDSKEFKPQWEEQLKAEGCRILVSDFMGRSCFLIRKPQPSNNSTLQQTQIEEKPKPQNIEQSVVELIKQGLGFKEIRQTLGLSHAQLMGHLSGLRKKGVLDSLGWVPVRRRKHLKRKFPPIGGNLAKREKQPSTQEAKPSLNASNLNVREVLEVSLKILDEYPRIAKFLLQKCMDSLT